MTSPDLLDELVPLARGPVRPLTAEQRDLLLAGVLRTAVAHPVAVPHEPLARRRRPALIATVVVGAALAAGVAAYVIPWPSSPRPVATRADAGPHPASPPSRVGGAAPLPALVPPAAFEQQRVAGDRDALVPDGVLRRELERTGRANLVVPVKVCVDAKGAVAAVTVLMSSGVAAFDGLVGQTIRGWRFQPFTINGQPAPACAVVQMRASMAPAVPPAPPKPAIVPPSAFESHRKSGERNIFPDDATKAAIAAAGIQMLLVPIKVCVDAGGAVTLVTLLKSSGFPAYDARLATAIRAWTYRPIEVDGAAAPVCSVVQVRYAQR